MEPLGIVLFASAFACVLGAVVICLVVIKYGFTRDSELPVGRWSWRPTRIGHAIAGALFGTGVVLGIIALSAVTLSGRETSVAARLGERVERLRASLGAFQGLVDDLGERAERTLRRALPTASPAASPAASARPVTAAGRTPVPVARVEAPVPLPALETGRRPEALVRHETPMGSMNRADEGVPRRRVVPPATPPVVPPGSRGTTTMTTTIERTAKTIERSAAGESAARMRGTAPTTMTMERIAAKDPAPPPPVPQVPPTAPAAPSAIEVNPPPSPPRDVKEPHDRERVGEGRKADIDADSDPRRLAQRRPRKPREASGDRRQTFGHISRTDDDAYRRGYQDTLERGDGDRSARGELAIRLDGTADRLERRDRSERSERGDRGDREDRSRSERGERLERSERGERLERAERSERIERAERPERAERAERPERVERAERPERAERAERGERGERPERPERRGR
jgi:hypothetical protein